MNPKTPIVTKTEGQPLWMMAYRPQTVEECILPESIKSVLRPFSDVKVPLQHLILNGPPGAGKTTSALAIATEREANVLMISASKDGGIDTLRNQVYEFAMTRALSFDKVATTKIVILDEADRLSPAFQDALRNAMEELSHVCSFILTCNQKSKISEAIQSRSTIIDFAFTKAEKESMFPLMCKRVANILKIEGVPFDRDVLAKIVWKKFPDFRSVMNSLQRYSRTAGGIDVGALVVCCDLDIAPLFSHVKNREFKEMQNWVKANLDNDLDSIYRKVYDTLYEFLDPACIPEVIIMTHDYMSRRSAVADPEISAVAYLTHLGGIASWKQ